MEPSTQASSSRLLSLDALRGTVMIVMALDHVRDFAHAGAAVFSPTDLTKTTALLFLTRWVTHFCLPVFLLTAGAGAYLRGQRSGKGKLAAFLWKRGLWFVLLEVTVMRLAYNFSFSLQYPYFLLVLWIFGLCMLALAALIYLPTRVLAAVSLAALLGEGLLDRVQAAQLGPAGWLWTLLHQPGLIALGGASALISYPLIPWLFVMSAGYATGPVWRWEAADRRRLFQRVGVGLTLAFVVIRWANAYGDPAPWSVQKSSVFTVLSFLNCTKYPGSLDFLLMTLGPAFLLLAWMEGRRWSDRNPVVVFGRVPLFYFVLHFFLIHLLVGAMAWARYGSAALFFSPVPAMGGSAKLFPAGFGWNLAVVYALWAVVVALLYPACRWFANLRKVRRDWWLSYL